MNKKKPFLCIACWFGKGGPEDCTCGKEKINKGKRLVIGALVAMILSTGCATAYRQSASSGFMGCDEETVEISNEKSRMNFGGVSYSWVAQCNGKKFYCNETNNGMIGGVQTRCAPQE